MQKLTHIAMGVYWYLLLERLFQPQDTLMLGLLILLGSLLPDIDLATSTLGKRAKLIGGVFKHRGFIHTVFLAALFSVFVFALSNDWLYVAGFGGAYFFHLLLDAFTPAGIKPLWFGPKLRGVVRTGKAIDWFLFGFLAFVSVLMVANII